MIKGCVIVTTVRKIIISRKIQYMFFSEYGINENITFFR